MRGLLAEKNVHTFADLVDSRFAADPRFRYKVRVIGSDVTSRCLLALPQDADGTQHFGIPPDDLEVALAENASFVRTIPIPTLGICRTNFQLTPAQVDALYASGRQAAESFLATWSFEA